MKSSRASRQILAGIACLLLAAILAWWSSTRPTEAERRMAEALAWMEAHPPKLSDRSIEPERRMREEAVQLASRQWYEELLESHPGLQIEWRDVPDERNGLLQLAELVNKSALDSRGGMAAISEEIIEMIEGRVAWDPVAFRKWSNQNQELMDTVLAISEMPDRSARDITYHDPLAAPPQFVSDMGFLLRATGRLAFDDGDEDLAFRYHAAAMNLAAHLDQVEKTPLLSVIVAHQIRQSVRTEVADNLLPAMSGSHDTVQAWRQMLSPSSNPSPLPANTYISEWHIITREIMLPSLLSGDFSRFHFASPTPDFKPSIPDPALFLDSHAAYVLENAGRLEQGETLISPEQSAAIPDNLSAGGKALLDTLWFGATVYDAFNIDRTRAAMSDAVWAAHLGEPMPEDPVSGLPFVWDPEEKLLSPPVESPAIPPVSVE